MKTLTLSQAKELKHGTIVFHVNHKNSDGSAQKWKVNGKVKTWKRSPEKVQISVKYGMYRYDYITENELHLITLEEPVK